MTNYETHNDIEINFNGTHLQGYVTTTWLDLISAFGQPLPESDGYKIDWEWVVEFDDGTIATIYNWKNGPNYLGPDAATKDQIKEWHVGGRDPIILLHLEEILDATIETHETRMIRWRKLYT